MTLVGIVSVGTTPEQQTAYSFQHARDHDDIDAALLLIGQPQPALPLDPMPPLDQAQFWLITHQMKHNAMNAAFGLSGDDLTKYDLSKQEEFGAFAGINFSEHSSVYQALSARNVLVGG